ncbi:MAG: VCBS repeat-containing protein [Planctomyces sp.]|nr:VCBS repeat-containing protein [Planctomyces sp.]
MTRLLLISGAIVVLAGVFAYPTARDFMNTRNADERPVPKEVVRQGPTTEIAAPLNSHDKMIDALARVKSRRNYEQVFFGPDTVESEERTLELGLSSGREQFMSLMHVAERRLWHGDTRRALKHLDKALTICDQAGAAAPKEILQQLYAELGLVWLRVGENENCVNCSNGESCLAPISGAGIHQNRKGSEEAFTWLLKALELNPDDYTSRWLLNVAAMTLGRYPHDVPEQFRVSPEAFESRESIPRFQNIAGEIGLNTLSLAGGIIVEDFDGDGDLDVLTSSWGDGDELQFMRNDNGRFRNNTIQANLSGIFGGLNLVQADYDNDGDVDVLVLRGAWCAERGCIPNSLLQNDGTGRFTDVSYDCGIASEAKPTQTAAWFDFDNDGDLDVYIGNEDMPSSLFENIEDGRTFKDIAVRAGVTNDRFAKGVIAADFNSDGFADLYVSNLYGPNRLYMNNRDGTFTDRAVEKKVTEPLDSFPVWAWDFNQDGHLDIMVCGYTFELHGLGVQYFGVPSKKQFSCLYLGDGQGNFQEVAVEKGLTNELPPMGANFGDLNNDGYPDFYLGTGAPQYQGLMPNLMYLNQQGQQFSDVTTSGGFGHLQKGHAISFADFDEDGDQDVFAVMGGAFPGDPAVNAVYRNPGFNQHWLTVTLIGKQTNRSAVGAKVTVETLENGQQRTIHKWVGSGGSFGANPLRCEIGLGQCSQIASLKIQWPGTVTSQVFHEVEMDRIITIHEGEAVIHVRGEPNLQDSQLIN